MADAIVGVAVTGKFGNIAVFVVVGDWIADNKDGVGILSFKGGNEYSGEFVGDKR